MNNYILDNTNGYGDVTRLTSANCGTPWSGSYTQIVYGPGGDKLALMNAQSLVKAFVPLNGGATAVYTSAGLDHYRHSDWLGSNRLSSTPSRTVQWSGAYAPWGELYASSPSGSSDPSFTGQNSDTSSTGEYDFLYRQYGTQGRWPTPDRAGLAAVNPSYPQSWNRYAYVLNNPLNSTDSLGLWCNYMSDDGLSVDTQDFNSSPDECGGTGGEWVDPSPNNDFGSGQCSPGAICVDVSANSAASFGGDLNTGDFSGSWGPDHGGGGFWNGLKNTARKIGSYIQVPCGAGGFAYGGGRASVGVVSASANKIVSIDSRSGYASGNYYDVTAGEGLQGGGGHAVYKDGSKENFGFIGGGADVTFFSVSLTAYGSHVTNDPLLQVQAGLNLDISIGNIGGGLGLGTNFDSLTSCVDHRFH